MDEGKEWCISGEKFKTKKNTHKQNSSQQQMQILWQRIQEKGKGKMQPSRDTEAEAIRMAYHKEPDDVFNTEGDDPYYEYRDRVGNRYFVFEETKATKVCDKYKSYIIIRP